MLENKSKITICYFVGTHGEWGGASRIIFNIIRNIDKKRFHPIVMLTATGDICQELEQLGVSYFIWQHEKKFHPISHLFHLMKCVHFFLTKNVDIVVLNYGCLGWRPAELLAAKLIKKPIIQHCQQVLSAASPYTRFSNLILTCSNYVRITSNFPPVRTQTVYDIVDVNQFGEGVDIREQLDLDESHIVITFLGRKRKSKGLDLFVSLANKIPGENIRFLVAGQRIGAPNTDSYSDDEMNQLLDMDSRILYVGYRSDVANIYAISDIIVMPSKSEEPCPAVTLEAAASGRPMVATDTGATKELVLHGKSGFLAQKDDTIALLEYVRRLVDDPQLRAAMGEDGKALARERFFRQPIEQLHKIYETSTGSSHTKKQPK